MHRDRMVVVVLFFLFTATALHAQHGAGHASGASGQRQTMRQQQNPMQQGSRQQSMRTQQQTRVQSQATDQQRSAMKQSLTATKQLRSELRQLTRLHKGQQIGTEQANRWRERIRKQLLALQQEQEILLTSLTEEQQSFATEDIQQMNESTTDLVETLDALDMALAEEELDEEAVKQAAKKADDKAKKVENEEKDILDELGLGL